MDAFHVLSDPTRRLIIEQLSSGALSFGELADKFEISRPAVSQHLKVLKSANMVVSKTDAQRRIYSLQESALDEITAWVQKVRQFWNPRLDQLENLVAREASK